jgi:transglutaminase-like putative cysteine protease
MDRRTLLASLAGAALPLGAAAEAPGGGWRRFEITTSVDLSVETGPADIWLPLAGEAPVYQRRLARRLSTNGRARLVRDDHYRDALLKVTWTEPGPRHLAVIETVATQDRAADGAHLSGAEQAFWTASTPSLPLDGIVGETARRITAGHDQPPARLRAIYDWVVDNTFRDAATRGCGIGGVEAMLRSGQLGGKCADINGLMVGLSRAAGVPARDAYGLRVGPSRIIKTLGAGADVTHAQHCRAEMWLAGQGWFPVDPADVRKVVLEAKLPVDSPPVKAERERLFGHWEMNWIVYNHATDIALPGAPRPMEEHFLMYPCAMTPARELDQLSPDTFRYRIAAREITA